MSARELESLGLRLDEVLDFSASINPLGAAPGVKEVLRSLPPDIYPDPSCLKLRRALSSRLDIQPDSILVGNGSTEDNQRLVQALKATTAVSDNHE